MSHSKEKKDIHYTEGVREESTTSMIFDSKFIGILTKRFPDAKVISICIATSEKKEGRICLFHQTRESHDERKMTVEGGTPEVFDGILQVIDDFEKEE